jgi:hypothetical protein
MKLAYKPWGYSAMHHRSYFFITVHGGTAVWLRRRPLHPVKPALFLGRFYSNHPSVLGPARQVQQVPSSPALRARSVLRANWPPTRLRPEHLYYFFISLIAVAVLATVACSKKEAPSIYSFNEKDSSTTNPYDAEMPADAAWDVAITADGDDDAGEDAATEEVPFTVDVSGDGQFADARGYSLSAEVNTFALAYENHILNEDCHTRIYLLTVPSFGPIPDPESVVNNDLYCAVPKEPAVVYQKDAWQLAWTDNRAFDSASAEFTLDVYTMAVDSNVDPSAITDDTLSEGKAELAVVNSTILAAWISERVTDENETKRSIKTRVLNPPESDETIVVPEDDNRMPEGLVLAAIGKNNAVLGWVDRSPDNRGVFVLPLDSNGVAKQSPDQLSKYDATSLDIATGSTSNAAVYSIIVDSSKTVRFQTLNGIGGVDDVRDERKLITSPEQGLDASIVYWGTNGYLITYRAVSGADSDSAMIRLFVMDLGINWNPSALQPRDVAAAASSGGRTTVRLANDGTFAVAWLDAKSADDKILNLRRFHH